MRAFVVVVIAALALPGTAAAQLEPVQDLLCPLLQCSVPGCGAELAARNDELATCNDELASAPRLPATGQTSSRAPGDDGDLEWGATLSFTDNGDGTITDNNTGLMWEKKANKDFVVNPDDLHDADNNYTWDAGLGGIFFWIQALNSTNFAGHNDWRVPNAKELYSILDLEPDGFFLPPAFSSPCRTCTGSSCVPCTDITSPDCSCNSNDAYWTSTEARVGMAFSLRSTLGFIEDLGGLDRITHTETPLPVRAVRGGSQ